MSRDPFDEMRRMNPVPPETLPGAPMGVANRIVGARMQVPGWVAAVAAAAAVVAIGGTSLLFLNRSGSDPVAVGDSTTSSISAPTTAPVTIASDDASSTTVVAPFNESAGEVVVYLLVDDPTAIGPTPGLIPVARSLATISSEVTDSDLPRLAVGFLLAGPTPDESVSVPAFSTAVPEGTTLLGVEVRDRVATVDLSGEFAAGSGSFSEVARLEQLTYTLTRFEEIDGIRIKIDGVPVDVFGSHGIVLDDPVTRTEIDMTLPAILIEDPPYPTSSDPALFSHVGYPLVASGTANVFEATISVALTDADGLILWEGFTNATCGTGCRGDWSISIPYAVDVAQRGSLIVWEASARDGSQTNVREHPVWLIPADDGVASAGDLQCSGARVDPVLVDQSDLPPANAAMRAAIFEAAVLCDWDALRALQAEGFRYSFGINDDPIASWQQLEIDGEQPIRFLAELLNRPYGNQPGPGTSEYYSWPSAFVTEWSLVSDADREALRPLYDDEDFTAFSEFGGYFGYRVGIIDGTWVYFLVGD